MIYFITARGIGLVKIGYATKPQERFHTISVHSPVDVLLERVCPGELRVEADLQGRFASARVRGEWFTITPEIEAFMDGMPRHEWKHRGWHHAARRAELAASASRNRPTPDASTERGEAA